MRLGPEGQPSGAHRSGGGVPPGVQGQWPLPRAYPDFPLAPDIQPIRLLAKVSALSRDTAALQDPGLLRGHGLLSLSRVGVYTPSPFCGTPGAIAVGPLPIQAEGALGTSSPQPCHLAYYQAPSCVVALTEGEWLLGACYPELAWGLATAWGQPRFFLCAQGQPSGP